MTTDTITLPRATIEKVYDRALKLHNAHWMQWDDNDIAESNVNLSIFRTALTAGREALAHHTPSTTGEAAIPIELQGIKETVADSDGFWRSCTGCHETNDGHPSNGAYFSATFNCHLGGGCSECGGIGAIWDNTDYEDMANFMIAQDATPPQVEPAPSPEVLQALTDPENQPNQFGVKFGMHGPRMFFAIGNQSFDLAYEPDEPEEFEFMKRMLCNAFSTFTPDVKTEPAPSTAWEPERLYDAIKECMLHHRLQSFMGEDGEHYPLVDHLSCDQSIEDGKHEIDLICDGIYNTVLKPAALLQSTPGHIGDANKMVAAMPVGELTDEQILDKAQIVGGLFDKLALSFQADDVLSFARAILAAASSQPPNDPEDLYWKLHSLSKSMEGSGRIDQHDNPEAYGTLLDAMNALRSSSQPVREPMTDSWILERCAQSWVFETAKQWVRMAEAAHGITKKGGEPAEPEAPHV